MALSCLRSKLCKICLLFFLVALAVVAIVLWHRAVQDGAVEFLVPVHRMDGNDLGNNLGISILPESPRVHRGYTAQLVCIVIGASVTQFAPPPTLPPPLLSSIRVSTLPGGAVLIVESAQEGHAGQYTCHAQGTLLEQLQLSVVLTVDTDDMSEVELEEQLETSTSPSHPPSSPTSHITSPPVTTLPPSHNETHSSQITSPENLPSDIILHSSPPSLNRKRRQLHGSVNADSDLHVQGLMESSQHNMQPQKPDRGSDFQLQTHKERMLKEFSEQSKKPDRGSDFQLQTHKERMLTEYSEQSKMSIQTHKEWMSANISEQSKFQRGAVDRFCTKFSPLLFNSSHFQAYNRHMLTDDMHSILFCFLPKTGCTNLKLLFFVNQGLIPRSELDKLRDDVDQSLLMNAVLNSSFTSLDRVSIKKYVSRFFKFIMVRNPLERLASAFRSKIERYNLTGRLHDTPHYNWARHAILRQTHPAFYRAWFRGGTKLPVPISFSDFINYWLNPTDPRFEMDDHFRSLLEICQPCRTRFDFYGNFHHFDRDAEVLIDKIGASRSDLRQGYYSENTSTEERMKLYYSILTDAQKKAVLNKMALELEFYYAIFPEERDSHKQILDIDYEYLTYL